jgi:hypothetical protein
MHTITVRNLNISWTRRPGVYISSGNKEVVLERSTQGRKLLNVTESKSKRVSFPCSRGYDTFIALSWLGGESDGCTLMGSAQGQRSGRAEFYSITYSKASKGLK